MRAFAMLLALLLAGCDAGALLPCQGAGAAGGCQSRVLVEDVINARDLGGWTVAEGTVPCQRLLRGGALTGLTEAGCSEFAALGIRTIVDLREQAVQDETPPPACATRAAQHRSAAMPKLPDTPENYLLLLEQTAAIQQIFTLLADADRYPVYLHCEIGRDRASFVSALILLALGADRQTVLDEFALSALAGVPVKSECMSAVLDEIERRGGIAAALATSGVDAAVLSAMRHNAMEER